MKQSDGLTDEEVIIKRKEYGNNSIGEYHKNSFIKLIIKRLVF